MSESGLATKSGLGARARDNGRGPGGTAASFGGASGGGGKGGGVAAKFDENGERGSSTPASREVHTCEHVSCPMHHGSHYMGTCAAGFRSNDGMLRCFYVLVWLLAFLKLGRLLMFQGSTCIHHTVDGCSSCTNDR